MFDDKKYSSASAALEAYIHQHEGLPLRTIPSHSTDLDTLLMSLPDSKTVIGKDFTKFKRVPRLMN